MTARCLPLLIALSLAACQRAAPEPAQTSSPAVTGAAVQAVAPADVAPAAATQPVFDETSLRPLLESDDQILAFKHLDLTGDGQDDAVAIVRHATAPASGNACELLVLQRKEGAWRVADRSPQAVDCLYNDVARNAQRLDENLTLKPREIVYVNQQARSNVTYTLKYDTARQAWYLAEASSTTPVENSRSGAMEVLQGTVRYPDGLAWTPIAKIDPEALQEAMDKHRAAIP